MKKESPQILNDFYSWLNINTTLSDSSIEKYKRAVNTVSKDMLGAKVITKSLFDMSLTELDFAIANILKNKAFIEKNSKGNNMYSCGLKQFRCFILDVVDDIDNKAVEIVDTIINDPNIKQTEKESLVKSRLGQGIFRKELIKKYEGKCVVTGIDIGKVLIASHIIPWSVSDNTNRLNPENGILLSATFDKLFDCGLITFKNSGEIIASRLIKGDNKKKLGLDNKIIVNLKTSNEMIHNLEYHRDVVFVK